MLDIHSHILHRFDDGPVSLDKSIELMKELEASGVTDVVASSHFYSHRMSIDEFCDRRDRRIAELKEAATKNGIGLNIISGAEVHIDRLLLNAESLRPLCIEGTNTILLEIPHDTTDVEEPQYLIEKIMSYYSVRPVIAHVERYGFFFRKMANLAYFKDMGCVIQIDAVCLLSGIFMKHFALKAIKKGYVDVIASDCHDTALRDPNLAKAYAVVEKKLGAETVKRLKDNAQMLVEKE